MISSLDKLGILVTHYQADITEAPSQIIKSQSLLSTISKPTPSSSRHPPPAMTAPVDTPDPGRYPDGNRIIAQTLHDAHGSGVATAPEPLALFTEQYDATNGRVIRFTPTNRGVGAGLTPSSSGHKRASGPHAPSTPSSRSPRRKRASTRSSSMQSSSMRLSSMRSLSGRSILVAAASIASATCTAAASIALPPVVRRNYHASSSNINKAFEPAPPSIAKKNTSNFGLIPKSDLLRWIRPDAFRLNAVYSEREINQGIKNARTLLQYQFNQTGNNPNMGINVADAEKNECDQRIGGTGHTLVSGGTGRLDG